MINVVYACNDNLFKGLFLSILSILRRSKSTFNFYVLTGSFKQYSENYVEISKEHAMILNKLVKQYNNKNNINIINCEENYYKYFGKENENAKNRCSIYTLFRLLIDTYPKFKGKVIYLDTDTMAVGDIKQLNDVDVDNYEFACCHNMWAIRWYQKKDYFNAGVLLFNIDECRKTGLFVKCRELLNKGKVFNSDQMALYKSASKKRFFPKDEYRFNRQNNKIKEGDIIKHFMGQVFGLPGLTNIKQWEIQKVHKYLKFHHFDKDYEIFRKHFE